MVMVTRSARRRACGIFQDSNSDNSYNVPPWCTSGKFFDVNKQIPVGVCEQTIHPQQRDFRKYSCKSKTGDNSCCSKKRRVKSYRDRNEHKVVKCQAVVCLSIVILILGSLASLKMFKTAKSRNEILSLLGVDKTVAAVDEECCYKMRQLSEALLRANEAIRMTRRQHTLMLTTQTKKLVPNSYLESEKIRGATASKGSGTEEWAEGRAALWGVVPLWRASPPPQTVLAERSPTPADCWPFRGSEGEVVIQLAHPARVRHLSLEHIRPDAARSAPKEFTVFAILENGTWVKSLNGEYTYEGPAKQFYTVLPLAAPVKQVAFRVHSNHGNPKYTCVYRVHVYGKQFVDNTL